MLAYILKRLLATIPVMATVAVIVFMLLHLTPGDPAALIGGDLATPEDLRRIREQLGLERPIAEQFLGWLWQVLQGDLGTSLFNQMPVSQLIAQRIEPTLIIGLTIMTFAVIVAIPLGVIAAWKAGSWIDQLIMTLAVIAFSMPIFLIGYLLIFKFSVELKWFPVRGYQPMSAGPAKFFPHIVLPSLTVSFIYIALLTRMTRATVLDVLNQDYMRTARAKGMATPRILAVHALKNAAVPIVTMVGIGLSSLLGGIVVTETVFAIPGIGRLMIDAIIRRDFPILQGVILVLSALYVLINLLIDLSYSLFDPRIRY
ncbi:putative peptide ABC transporter permease protein y4tP [Bosea sp. 62]|uniref:ABC transporter permease n=1 Tax=unclassified Bosea (in: a-proteobacteria) TaxID=2653178 RepID=UPI00125C5304|nr:MULTISPECIES: ABC transporter permease [unclassified Bosea (in: a-proteobacteria)]CAD5251271.1 putative peptide ABC transporter permease protein y4tP [Bosea sp. 7B]CAD5280815.1 putative peptide ABC transporter permease protein y4tP [Bosea sp. 21B]CAD5281979.1 putative peptide ABC transporter permease protein y4tP [Bosea sp. 46]VVT59385.1 putative peptide ABC transporter permease protein y4tP [Bosea sp. EC-HK365B]VXB26888.1 putative peptide ABC transporter permease protein y4tP [Bosea sp. 62